MFKTIICVLALVAASSARVQECGTQGAPGSFPEAIRITDCTNDELCRIIRGSDMTLEIDFISLTESQTLRPQLIATAFGIRAEYELTPDRQIGCDWVIGTRCPLSTGEFVTYQIAMPVPEEYPLTVMALEIRLFDQNNVNHFCVHLDGEVVAG